MSRERLRSKIQNQEGCAPWQIQSPGRPYHHCYHREESEERHSFPSMVPTWDK